MVASLRTLPASGLISIHCCRSVKDRGANLTTKHTKSTKNRHRFGFNPLLQ